MHKYFCTWALLIHLIATGSIFQALRAHSITHFSNRDGGINRDGGLFIIFGETGS